MIQNQQALFQMNMAHGNRISPPITIIIIYQKINLGSSLRLAFLIFFYGYPE